MTWQSQGFCRCARILPVFPSGLYFRRARLVRLRALTCISIWEGRNAENLWPQAFSKLKFVETSGYVRPSLVQHRFHLLTELEVFLILALCKRQTLPAVHYHGTRCTVVVGSYLLSEVEKRRGSDRHAMVRPTCEVEVMYGARFFLRSITKRDMSRSQGLEKVSSTLIRWQQPCLTINEHFAETWFRNNFLRLGDLGNKPHSLVPVTE